MRLLLALLVCTGASVKVQAQTIELDPTLDLRLRFEQVDQIGVAERGQALTLRARPGMRATDGRWTALVEAEATVRLAGSYNDGVNGRGEYPLIVDPSNLELNRAQLHYTGRAGQATAGRQRIELGDQRFVGSAMFRQNEQTFDAVRLRLGKDRGLSVDASMAWSMRTVQGRDGSGARPTAIGGENVFLVAKYQGTAAQLSGFAYLVDQDAFPVQGFRLSSQTYGLRIDGKVKVGAPVQVRYAASWARQQDYGRNPNPYSADYWLVSLGGSYSGLGFDAGYEVLGADDGRPFTSVQTPLASHIRFNGWAGKFTSTPANGLRDRWAGMSYAWDAGGLIDRVSLEVVQHRFDGDLNNIHYGNETDFLATVRSGKVSASARYARYQADQFATDTEKFWLQLDLSL